MGNKHKRDSVDTELEKKRARLHFYARLRQIVIMGLFIVGFLVAALLYFGWWKKEDVKEPKGPRMVEHREIFGDGSGLTFDYRRMINLMREYSKLVIEEEAGAPWGNRPIEKLRGLLDSLQRERRAYTDYIELIRRSQSYMPTRKRQKATLHYMRSMEDAISDLQRILQNKGAVPVPSDLTPTGR
ncbi:hypothetical protein ACFLY6_03045 [Candidatus Dependentiae bacterium]